MSSFVGRDTKNQLDAREEKDYCFAHGTRGLPEQDRMAVQMPWLHSQQSFRGALVPDAPTDSFLLRPKFREEIENDNKGHLVATSQDDT